jgi:TRAP-type mannitol/chloroaromatic compound transport system permease large subunit
MLRYGYNRTIATGTITASGTLAQAIPPSLVLIVLADQLGRSVGDMYAGALFPGLMLVGLYLLFIFAVALIKPNWVPALPPEARIYRESSGASGHRSLLALLALCAAVGWGWSLVHSGIIGGWIGRETPAPTDETLILSMTIASFLALLLAMANRMLGFGLLSKLAEQVTFVLIPPLVLIFLVLGTIFLGIATPTEGGAMGALGALIMAGARRKLGLNLLKQALDSTAKLSVFVMFILIGSTVFSFTFNAADGHIWVEHLFDKLPGGQLGFLLVVNLLVFVLGMFIDFFEIAFIVVPILAPVADKMGIDLIWFGVILAMNLQTSFLTPPFGFALFYLRSVAAKKDYDDRITGERIPAVTTTQIYKGSIAFIILQLIMLTVVVFNPQLVSGNISKGPVIDADKALESMGLPQEDPFALPPESTDAAASGAEGGTSAPVEASDDPMKALQDAMKQDAAPAAPATSGSK